MAEVQNKRMTTCIEQSMSAEYTSSALFFAKRSLTMANPGCWSSPVLLVGPSVGSILCGHLVPLGTMNSHHGTGSPKHLGSCKADGAMELRYHHKLVGAFLSDSSDIWCTSAAALWLNASDTTCQASRCYFRIIRATSFFCWFQSICATNPQGTYWLIAEEAM